MVVCTNIHKLSKTSNLRNFKRIGQNPIKLYMGGKLLSSPIDW